MDRVSRFGLNSLSLDSAARLPGQTIRRKPMWAIRVVAWRPPVSQTGGRAAESGDSVAITYTVSAANVDELGPCVLCRLPGAGKGEEMRISELVALLARLQAEHGDMELVVDDPQCMWTPLPNAFQVMDGQLVVSECDCAEVEMV